MGGGGGVGVQAFRFGKTHFELGVGGEGQDTSRHLEDSFGSIRAILMAILAKLLDMDFKFVLPMIYSNFDIQTNFEVNQTQIIHSIPINTPKNH